MRRKNQEITDRAEIDAVIKNAKACRVGLADGDRPYVVPMCFGYDGKNLYLHCTGKGMKTDILNKNPNVCFEIDEVGELEEANVACDWGIKYKSVIGFGKASFIDDTEEKKQALGHIMNQYSSQSFEFPEKMIKVTTVIKVDIEELTGKHSS